MNTLNAFEIQLRGLSAIEEALTFGPVHIIESSNNPTMVVLHEADYQALLPQNNAKKNNTAIEWIMNFKSSGTLSKKAIDVRIDKERHSWEK